MELDFVLVNVPTRQELYELYEYFDTNQIEYRKDEFDDKHYVVYKVSETKKKAYRANLLSQIGEYYTRNSVKYYESVNEYLYTVEEDYMPKVIEIRRDDTTKKNHKTLKITDSDFSEIERLMNEYQKLIQRILTMKSSVNTNQQIFGTSNIVGEYAELLICKENPKLIQLPPSKKGFDLRDDDGNYYQVKSRWIHDYNDCGGKEEFGGIIIPGNNEEENKKYFLILVVFDSRNGALDCFTHPKKYILDFNRVNLIKNTWKDPTTTKEREVFKKAYNYIDYNQPYKIDHNKICFKYYDGSFAFLESKGLLKNIFIR